jgi:acetate kinase
MPDALLTLNAGSSSLKFSIFRDGDPPLLIFRGQFEELMTRPRFSVRDAASNVVREQEWKATTVLGDKEAIEFLFDWGRSGMLGEHRIVAVGHRIVHGGIRFTEPVMIDPQILLELEALVPLAPLHQSHNVSAIKAVARHAPQLPQVACFDTAFHRSQSPLAQAFALPRCYAEQGILRYGFHGLSYEYISSRLSELDARAAVGRTVVAHLGNGASMCALHAGNSIATTMSFTPIDGLPMGTRCGAIDPGVLLHLLKQGMDLPELEKLLYYESGLLGVSGVSSDVRTLLASSDRAAAEALELFVYRCGRELGSLAAALGGIDALVFTGGIGANAAAIRARICRDARWLGLEFDEEANALGGPRLTRADSRVSAWVIATNEELMIALHTRRVLASSLKTIRSVKREDSSD